MDIHLEILIPAVDPMQREILIAELTEQGFEGFEEEDTQLHAFVKQDEFHENEFMRLLQRFGLPHEKKSLPEQNWNEIWERNFEPVCVGNFCVVRSAFHNPDRHAQFELIITPKMSFGTGHHATTYMMIEGMERLTLAGKSVFDFGTGTGILAILAEKMGAASIHAIDNDDWSISNARENLAVNECQKIRLEKASEISTTQKFDFIFANINKKLIFNTLHQLEQQMRPGGVLLLSGLLMEDLPELTTIADQRNLQMDELNKKDNWICIRLKKISRN